MIKRSELLLSCSYLLDLLNPLLSGHQQRVAYIAAEIATALNLEENIQLKLLSAGLVHDLGLIVYEEEADCLLTNNRAFSHPQKGAELLSVCPSLQEFADLVNWHHPVFSEKNDKSFPEAIILSLADQIEIKLRSQGGKETLYLWLEEEYNSESFSPCVQTFIKLAANEEFWHNLNSDSLDAIISQKMAVDECCLSNAEFLTWAEKIASFVDFRTGNLAHSAAVTRISELLGHLNDFPVDQYVILSGAGYLHDLGKLAIPQSILRQRDPLSKQEEKLFKAHPLYTKQILDKICGTTKLSVWAVCHHERMNGHGYPLASSPEELDLGSKIIAAANFFITLLEKKPYRDVLEKDVIINILEEAGSRAVFDSVLLKMIVRNYDFMSFIIADIQNNEKI